MYICLVVKHAFQFTTHKSQFIIMVSSCLTPPGVVATNLDFTREVPDFIPSGQPVPVTIDATIDMEPYSRGVSGACLWKVNMFGSRNNDGSGARQPLSSQILDSYEAAIPLSPGGPLYFENLQADFDVSQLGCGEIGYLCLEFTQCDTPNPDFSFEASDGGESIVKCQAENCRGGPTDQLPLTYMQIWRFMVPCSLFFILFFCFCFFVVFCLSTSLLSGVHQTFFRFLRLSVPFM